MSKRTEALPMIKKRTFSPVVVELHQPRLEVVYDLRHQHCANDPEVVGRSFRGGSTRVASSHLCPLVPAPTPARTSVRKVPCERPLGSTERHRVHPGVQAFQPVVHAVPRVGRTPSLRKFSVGTRLVRGLNWRAWAFHPIWAQAAACAICRHLKLSENPIARAMLFM